MQTPSGYPGLNLSGDLGRAAPGLNSRGLNERERPGWLGPLFFWDILTQGRQRHLHVYRFAYAASLLVMLYFVLGHAELTTSNIALVAASAMNWVLVLQFFAVILLTPVFVAGVVIDERRRG